MKKVFLTLEPDLKGITKYQKVMLKTGVFFAIVHSEWPKLCGVLAAFSAIGLIQAHFLDCSLVQGTHNRWLLNIGDPLIEVTK